MKLVIIMSNKEKEIKHQMYEKTGQIRQLKKEIKQLREELENLYQRNKTYKRCLKK